LPRFVIHFHVEQLLSGDIEVEAKSSEAAAVAFYSGSFDEARLTAKLDLEDSEDAIVEIRACPFDPKSPRE
jgi:hypothetical protein